MIFSDNKVVYLSSFHIYPLAFLVAYRNKQEPKQRLDVAVLINAKLGEHVLTVSRTSIL